MFALTNVAGTCHRGNLSAESAGTLRRVVADTISRYLGDARNDAR